MIEDDGWPALQVSQFIEQHRSALTALSTGIKSSKGLVSFAKRVALALTTLTLQFTKNNSILPPPSISNRVLQAFAENLAGFHSNLAARLLSQVCSPLEDIITLMEEQLQSLKNDSFMKEAPKMTESVDKMKKKCQLALRSLKLFCPMNPKASLTIKEKQDRKFQDKVLHVEECFKEYESLVIGYNATIERYVDQIHQPRLAMIEGIETCRQQMFSDIAIRLEIMGRMLPSMH